MDSTAHDIDRGRLLYEGPIDELLAHTSSSYLLHVRPPADALLAALRALPWVAEVAEQAPGRLRLVVEDAARAEAEMTGVALVSFNPAADLETAFLELTR